MLYIAGFIGLSTAYWLGIAILAFLRPGREFPLGGKHGPWKRLVVLINVGAFIIFAAAVFYFRELLYGTVIVIAVALIAWSFLTTFFLLDALRGILYRFENTVRNVPKLSDSLIKNLILLGIIDVVLLVPILYITDLTVQNLQGLFSGAINFFGLIVLEQSTFIGILVLLAEIFLIGSLNVVSLFVFFRYRQRHSSKSRYVPYMQTLVILYTFIFGIKFLLFDINPNVDIFDILINSVILFVVVLLAIRKVAKWVGPIDLEDYAKRLNPRSLTLFFFTVSALQSILLHLVRFVGGEKFGQLLFYGVQIFTFVLWAPLAYLLVFILGDFPEAPETEPPVPEALEPETPVPEAPEGNQQE
ncbi:MAG: hypothetical protein ACFFCZ_12945 [Promethearchaeota archaeon]